MTPFAVITARAGSQRLPYKNMLPVGGRPMVHRAIHHAKDAGLVPVVTTDIPQLIEYTNSVGGLGVERPVSLRDGSSHIDTIKHAIEAAVAADPIRKGAPVVLLQPTSPFRLGGIIQRCVDKHLEGGRNAYSGRRVMYADHEGKKVDRLVWDGCVAVYGQDSVGQFEDSVIVENEHANMLQVDTDEDYIQACVMSWRLNGCRVPYSAEELAKCKELLAPIIKGGRVTLVGRPDGAPYDQSTPVAYTNHCVGYDGKRADILFVVASKNITQVGINPELAEVAQKAKVVIIRDFGQAEWLLANLKVANQLYVVKNTKHTVTTGAFSSAVLSNCGAQVTRVGFQRGFKRVPYHKRCFGNDWASDEIAILETTGKDRDFQVY